MTILINPPFFSTICRSFFPERRKEALSCNRGSCPMRSSASGQGARVRRSRRMSSGDRPGERLGVVSTASIPSSLATIAAVCLARTSGLDRIRSKVIRNDRRRIAMRRILRFPSGVRRRSSSTIAGGVPGPAIPCLIRKSSITSSRPRTLGFVPQPATPAPESPYGAG